MTMLRRTPRSLTAALSIAALTVLAAGTARADDPVSTPIPSYIYRCAIGNSELQDYATAENNPKMVDAKLELAPKQEGQRVVLASSALEGVTREVAFAIAREGEKITVLVATDKSAPPADSHEVHLAFSFHDGDLPPAWVHAESPISLDEQTTVQVRKGFWRRLFSKEKYDTRTQVTTKQVLADYAVVCARIDATLPAAPPAVPPVIAVPAPPPPSSPPAS